MGRIPTGAVVWGLKRYTKNGNMWDRVCFDCQQKTPVFEYEHHDEEERLVFHYICTDCAQKKLTEWLQHGALPEKIRPDTPTDFDSAVVFYEQKNDEQTLLLTRWSPEQRRRRLQGN